MWCRIPNSQSVNVSIYSLINMVNLLQNNATNIGDNYYVFFAQCAQERIYVGMVTFLPVSTGELLDELRCSWI
jgi:hypothetical protein